MNLGLVREAGLVLAVLLCLAACGPARTGSEAGKAPAPTEISFSILSAENQATTEPQWAPLIAELSQATGVRVRPFFATNYTALIEAMRAGQVQVGWFSALPALQAVNRSNGAVIGRYEDAGAPEGYRSVLIVRHGSGLSLDQLLACDHRRSFGIGDAQSTSGTLAPMTFLFAPRGIRPTDCFATVRSASHQANFFAVANGVIDAATSNSIELSRAARENAAMARNVEVIWQSPPLPSSSIVVRRDLDPALRERIRQFFLTYGVGDSPDAARQRAVLANLSFGAYHAADDAYLDPVRLMQATTALEQARHAGDAAAVARAQSEIDTIRRNMTAQGSAP